MDVAGTPPNERPGRRGADRGPRDAPEALSPLREQELLRAARAGDADALADLLRAYQRRVYGVCRRMVPEGDQAEDLTQETLVKVMEGLPGFDGRSRLSTWVIRIAMNCCLSHLRRQRLRRHGSLEEPAGPDDQPLRRILAAAGEPSASDRVEQDDLRRVLLAALGSLDPDARALLVLRDLQGLEYQQVGDVLGVPIGTVKSRLFRARAALREAAERLLAGGAEGDGPDPAASGYTSRPVPPVSRGGGA